MPKRRLSREDKHNKEVWKYTIVHGGPDITKIDDKYMCIKCFTEVPLMGVSKCPGCGKDIDWNKSVLI